MRITRYLPLWALGLLELTLLVIWIRSYWIFDSYPRARGVTVIWPNGVEMALPDDSVKPRDWYWHGLHPTLRWGWNDVVSANGRFRAVSVTEECRLVNLLDLEFYASASASRHCMPPQRATISAARPEARALGLPTPAMHGALLNFGGLIYQRSTVNGARESVTQTNFQLPYWMPFVILGIPLGMSLRSQWRSRRIRRSSERICVFCHYDLRASQDRCPECGHPIPNPPPTPPPVDADPPTRT